MLLLPFQTPTYAAGQAYKWQMMSFKDTHTHKSFFSKNNLIFLTNEETFSHVGQQKGDTDTSIYSRIFPQEHSNFASICLKNKTPWLFNITQVSGSLIQTAIAPLLEVMEGLTSNYQVSCIISINHMTTEFDEHSNTLNNIKLQWLAMSTYCIMFYIKE